MLSTHPCVSSCLWVNSLWYNGVICHQRAQSSLAQVIACRLCGTKPLPETIITYCQPNPLKHISLSWRDVDCFTPFCLGLNTAKHDSDVMMSAMASQITSPTIVCSTVYSGADQRKRQSSAWLAFVGVIHRWLVDSPHKGPVTRKMFPFDAVIMRKHVHIEIYDGIMHPWHFNRCLAKPPLQSWHRYVITQIA